MAAGDFSIGKLPQFKALQDSYWGSALTQRQYKANTNVIETVNSLDTSTMRKLFAEGSNALCEGVKLVWQKPGSITATMDTVSNIVDEYCDFSGTEGEADNATYQITKVIKASFKVSDDNCPNLISKSAKIAERKFEAIKAMLTQANLFAYTKLEGATGKTLYTLVEDDNIGYPVATSNIQTKINPGNLNYIDFPIFAKKYKQVNKYSNLSWIDGNFLGKQMMISMIQQGSPAGDVGADKGWGLGMDNYVDAFEDAVEHGKTSKMFAVEKGTMAVAYHNNHSDTPVLRNPNGGKERLLYTEELPLIHKGKAIKADVTYKMTEEPIAGNTSQCRLYHEWQYLFYMDIFINPAYTDGRTGTHEFIRDNAVSKKTNGAFPTYA
jgi:hypothetical protein